MLREITFKEAVALLEEGKTVKCLAAGGEPVWSNYVTCTLDEVLKGVICFAEDEDIPAQPKKNVSVTKPAPAPADPKPAAPAAPQRRIQLDMGKVRALKNAGWSVQKIADEMGVSRLTMNKVIQEMEKKKDGEGRQDIREGAED